MDPAYELAELLLLKEEGALAAKLPWRHFPGLLIDETSITAAQRLAGSIASDSSSEGAGADVIQDVAKRLTCLSELLASPWAQQLRALPEPPVGKALCIRPAQLARPYSSQTVYAVVHFDTLASLLGDLRSAAKETETLNTHKALPRLLSLLNGWYSLMRDAPRQ